MLANDFVNGSSTERTLDSQLASCDFDQGTSTARTFTWNYGGHEWTWNFSYTSGDADCYRGVTNRPLHDESDYLAFITTPHDDDYLASLASLFKDEGRRLGWSDDRILSMALAFVQSLPYVPDDVATGYDEFPRFPVETLIANGGDCEDTSLLFASLSRAMGYGTVLLLPPAHMAVGILAESRYQDGGGYLYGGHKYLFAETTGNGWTYGQVPPEYAGVSAIVLPVP